MQKAEGLKECGSLKMGQSDEDLYSCTVDAKSVNALGVSSICRDGC